MKILGMIVKGDNLFHVMKDLLNITNRSRTSAEQKVEQQPQREEVSTIRSKVRYVITLVRMIFTF